jgi:energy-coupling factor transporter ATP-binding protein EcfA2
MEVSPVAPPIVDLGRLAGWTPLPLSVRDARRQAGPLRERLARAEPPPARATATDGVTTLARLHRVTVRFDQVTALDAVDFAVRQGEVVAVMGRNGSGKSTLLAQIAGVRPPTSGRVDVGGADPAALSASALVARVGLVPQDASLLLYSDSVAAECASSDQDTNLAPGTTAAMLERVLPGLPVDHHPRDLSEGQRLALALAVVLAPAAPLLLLDEPTRGLDYPGKARLVGLLADLAADGHCVVMATHDVELVAQVATRAVVLADGEVVADGPARDVVCHSPVFAPQVSKILAPEPWLTVQEVRTALDVEPVRG